MKWPLLALVLLGGEARAQAPVQPYNGVTSQTGAKGFQPVDQTHGLYVATARYASAGAGQYAVNINSSTALTVPTNSMVAEICVETQAARYTDDGTTPTTSSGIPVAAGTCFQYAGPLAAFRIIGQTSGATMDVSYYK